MHAAPAAARQLRRCGAAPLGRAEPGAAKEAHVPATRRILFASDLSSASGRAFAVAMDLAKALKADLLLVHAVAPVVPAEAVYAPIADWAALTRDIKKATQGALDRLAAAARRRRLRVQTAIASGYAAEEILRIARERRVFAIVMGTHGRSGLSRLLAGSVATRVVAQATCPVVTVRST
jgi:nucleotide-binding universal stress UspA family protein